MINGATFGVLPPGITFKADKLKDGRYRFVYSETFHDRALVERTADMLRHAAGAAAKAAGVHIAHRLTRKGGIFTVKGTVAPERIGDLMVGEFMAWSTVGSMRLRDVFMTYAAGGAGGLSAKQQRREKAAKPKGRLALGKGPSDAELRRLTVTGPKPYVRQWEDLLPAKGSALAGVAKLDAELADGLGEVPPGALGPDFSGGPRGGPAK